MRKNYFFGVVLITIGGLFLLDNLGVADFGDIVHDFWPLILVIWGLSILMRRKETTTFTETTTIPTIDTELIHESNVFGDTYVNVSSQNFKGGSISTTIGDCDVDLSKVSIAEGEHILRIHSVFGDSRITVPKDAAVSISASATAGSLILFSQRKEGFTPNLQTSTPNYETSSRRLKIIVSKVFGDIRVS